jgi:IS4 transposase
LNGSIPSFIHISDGKMHDVKVLDILCEQGYIEAGAFYVMDKAYVDFARLYTLHMAKAFFVTRAKTNMQVAMVQSFPVATNTGLISDHHVRLAGVLTAARYPEPIRLVTFFDRETGNTFEFLTNNLTLPANTICALYKQRWQVELFFKWIKQHLRIKKFLGNSENAVKTQIWCAVSTYVLIAIIKKELQINASLYTLLQILSVSVFEKTELSCAFQSTGYSSETLDTDNQLNLFGI